MKKCEDCYLGIPIVGCYPNGEDYPYLLKESDERIPLAFEFNFCPICGHKIEEKDEA